MRKNLGKYPKRSIDVTNRPEKCIYCKRKNTVVGNGLQWKCRKCGRGWVKYPVVKKIEKGPPCPRCGGKSKSRGQSWSCAVCGKRWMKFYQQEPVLRYEDLVSAKVNEI